MHRNLRSFLDSLRRENNLVTVEAEVDPYLEIAEIHRRVIDKAGSALLFTKVKGSRFPVVTNLFGTQKRIALAFGPRPEQFVKEEVLYFNPGSAGPRRFKLPVSLGKLTVKDGKVNFTARAMKGSKE